MDTVNPNDKYVITEHDALTGETVVREMTKQEQNDLDAVIALGNSWEIDR